MDIGVLRGIATALALAAFVAVAAWAWSQRRRAAFDEAARLPLEEDPQSGEPR
ncbi:MAG: CcoQ/FixQ family Cbb3-type cytochrome c oxidase assembly chaperone [Gammaproteobacteria bacterium]|nr:CcoQ/FixQ family Cbb3-type cytochrome c oxidase assembly chaperone [Gammaproteobacteria bacterium]